MKKKLILKAGAVALAFCVAFSSFPLAAFATTQKQKTEKTIEETLEESEKTAKEPTTDPTDSNTETDIPDNKENTEETNPVTEEEATEPTEETSPVEEQEDTNKESQVQEPGETGATDNAQNSENTNPLEEKEDKTLTEPVVETEKELKESFTEEKKEEVDENAIERRMSYNNVDDIKIPTLYDGTYMARLNGTLQSRYDAREHGYITPVRDQGYWGSCWAFAAMAMAEANIVKKGLAGNTLDLSELQLAYFFYNTVADPLGNTVGDGNTALTDSYLDQGGNSIFTTFTLASWIGATDESKAPYENATSPYYALDPSLAFADDYHMQNAYWINMTDVNEVKNMIVQHGAVISDYYSDQYGNNTTDYYNAKNQAYYYNGPYTTNHAILIIGWDDSFSRNNFNTPPSRDGAWLIKNSWGTEFGKDGYFWISYEDASFANVNNSFAFVFDFESANNYDHNYQYDGSGAFGYDGIYNGGGIANIFTAKGNSPGGAENIDAVSFALYDVNVDYSIQIYTNLADSANPTSGTPMLATPKTGRTSFTGYYTIKLDQTVEVAQGMNFSVVITLSRASGSTVIYLCDDSYNNNDWVYFNNECEEGQSFTKISSGSSWRDLSRNNLTARIKAFTTNTQLSQPTGITLNKTSLTLKAGQKESLSATTTPVVIPASSITWSTSNKSVATVDQNGKVTVNGIGKANITATTSNGVSATCKVTGKLGKVTGLKASQTTKQVKLKWSKQSGVSGYEIYRYNSDNKKYEKIATTTKATKTSYTDKAREAGKNYQYKVRAYVKKKKKNTYSSYSSVLKTATKTTNPTLSGTAQKKKAKLSWDKVEGASGYEIYMSTKKSSGYSLTKTIKKGKTTSYTKSKLKKNKKYYFKIRAYKTAGGKKIYSDYSKVIVVKAK